MPNTRTLVFKTQVNLPVAEAYRVFTNPTALRDWLCDVAQLDVRTRQLYLAWRRGFYMVGEFTTLESNRRVAFTWNGKNDPAPTRVNVQFVEQDGATMIAVKHAGIGTGKKWTTAAKEIEQGWTAALENLKSVWEDGVDLRIARVPRLGIFVGDLNAEIAKQLGVPVNEGMRLEGTAEGSSARAAGLQKDDVIVKLAGKKIGEVSALLGALQGYHAGDQVQVVFYRGKEKRTLTMELAPRPIPPLPKSAQELADLSRTNYVQLNAELAQCVAGLTDQQANFRIAPGEWSIKEMVAHFIACERDFQSWLAELVNGGKYTNGQVDDSLEFRPNATLRLAVLVTRYPTMAALLDELKCSQEETLAMLKGLPAEFVARKYLYRRVADWMTQIVPTHFRDEHFSDLEKAVGWARQ